MNTHRPIDSKREEFRKYLERTGVLDAITSMLTHLYEETEKPADALGFVYKFLGDSLQDKGSLPKKSEIEWAEKLADLNKQVDDLKAKLAVFEKAEAEAEKEEEAILEDTTDPPAPAEPVSAAPAVNVVVAEAPTPSEAPAATPDAPEPMATVPSETPMDVPVTTA